MLSSSVRRCYSVLFLSIPLLLQIKLGCSKNTCHIRLDMVVAVDTSSSCTQAEFTQLLSQVKALVAKFPVGPGKTRLALIGMSQSAQVLANFNDVSSLSDFNSAVDRLSLTSERTEISKGMKLARESVLNTARSAPVPRLLVLVKDRRCSDRAMGSSDSELALIKSEANAVRSMGGTVHAVGIGSLWNSQELKSLFGVEYVLFKSMTEATESIKSLNKNLCLPTNCKHSGQSLKPGTCYGFAKHVLTVNAAIAMKSPSVGVCRQEISRSFQSCTEQQSCYKRNRSLESCRADGNLAIVEQWQFFNRKTQQCVTEETKHNLECSRAAECASQVADVIIVLDRSISLIRKYYTLVDAAKEIIKALHIGDSNVHIGVVSYSSRGYFNDSFRQSVKLEDSRVFDKATILKQVENMKKDKGFFGTFTGFALKRTKEIFESKGRRGVYKAVIIITDGESYDPIVLFKAVSDLKNIGVTIYAVGVTEDIKMNELKMMTSPESNNNLFILENFEQLKPWAQKFSMRLCMKLKPLNPRLCDADVALQSISPCVKWKMQKTLIKFKYDADMKCKKHFTNTVIDRCKEVCVDPIDGSDHLEGESWISMCHEFRCNKGGKPTVPSVTKKCVATDYSCKAIGSAPFQCRNIDGEVRENCQCVDKGGEAVLVVEKPS